MASFALDGRNFSGENTRAREEVVMVGTCGPSKFEALRRTWHDDRRWVRVHGLLHFGRTDNSGPIVGSAPPTRRRGEGLVSAERGADACFAFLVTFVGRAMRRMDGLVLLLSRHGQSRTLRRLANTISIEGRVPTRSSGTGTPTLEALHSIVDMRKVVCSCNSHLTFSNCRFNSM